jgi:predicted nucleic acid-binding protein
VVLDASAAVALAMNEPEGQAVAEQLEGAEVYAPRLLGFELANAAWKKIRQQGEAAGAMISALERILDPRWGITWMDVDHADTVAISLATGLSVYDASYVWLAGVLGADLVTLDQKLVRATASGAASQG